jgi:hypothetical protein
MRIASSVSGGVVQISVEIFSHCLETKLAPLRKTRTIIERLEASPAAKTGTSIAL